MPALTHQQVTDTLDAIGSGQTVDGRTRRTLDGMLMAAVSNQNRNTVRFPRFVRTYQSQFEPAELRSVLQLELGDSTPLIRSSKVLLGAIADFDPEMLLALSKLTLKDAVEKSLNNGAKVRVPVANMFDAEELRRSARSNQRTHLAGEVAADAFTLDELAEVSMVLATADVDFSLTGISNADALVSVLEMMRDEEFYPEFISIDQDTESLRDLVDIAADYAVDVAVVGIDSLGPVTASEVVERSASDFFAL